LLVACMRPEIKEHIKVRQSFYFSGLSRTMR
jgi:hypothetical protein